MVDEERRSSRSFSLSDAQHGSIVKLAKACGKNPSEYLQLLADGDPEPEYRALVERLRQRAVGKGRVRA
jgi:hypothetical protein